MNTKGSDFARTLHTLSIFVKYNFLVVTDGWWWMVDGGGGGWWSKKKFSDFAQNFFR